MVGGGFDDLVISESVIICSSSGAIAMQWQITDPPMQAQEPENAKSYKTCVRRDGHETYSSTHARRIYTHTKSSHGGMARLSWVAWLKTS